MFSIDWNGLDAEEKTGVCHILFGNKAESIIFYNHSPMSSAFDVITNIVDCAKHYEENDFEDVIGEYSSDEQAEKYWAMEKQCSEKLHNLFTEDEYDFISSMVGY